MSRQLRRTTHKSPRQPPGHPGVEGPGDDRDLVVALDLQRPGFSSCWARKRSLMAGTSSAAGSKMAWLPTSPLVRQLVAVVRRLRYHQGMNKGLWADAPHGSHGDHYIVPIFNVRWPVVAVEPPPPRG